jgi:hypothetical protein
MSTAFAESFQNPYASPAPESRPAPAAIPAEKPGSIAIFFAGFILLLGGYFTSNIFLIADLYHVPFGPNGKAIPSPFAASFSTAPQQWMLYAACAAGFVAGVILIGSQRFNPMTLVACIMCPLVGLIILIASPLRIARKYAEPVAAVYLLIGSCLAFTGLTQMFRLYGAANDGFAPVAASLMAEAGLAFIIGALIKFWCMSAKAVQDGSEIFVAELADSVASRS